MSLKWMRDIMLSIYQNTGPGMSTLQCNDFEVTLTRKRIKNINLRISRDGSVHISAPLRASIHNIQQFIEQKQNWIRTHRDQILARAIPKNHAFNTGDLYPFLGQDYSVIIHEHSQQEGITFEKPYISCYVKAQATLELKQSLFQNWQRAQMKLLLPDLIRKWEPVMGVQVGEWGVKRMKTRWGSCNPSSKKIWMNLQLIHEPLRCLEYVLVHEMVHLLEASHNKRFHALMSKFLPEWRDCKNQLRHAPIFI